MSKFNENISGVLRILGELIDHIDDSSLWKPNVTNTGEVYTWSATLQCKQLVGICYYPNGTVLNAYSIHLTVRYDRGVWSIVTAYPVS